MEAAMGTPRSSAYECVGEYSWLPAWLPAVGSWRENSACDVKEETGHTHTQEQHHKRPQERQLGVRVGGRVVVASGVAPGCGLVERELGL